MAQLIALHEYRARKQLQIQEEQPPPQRPRILDAEIWSKNYSCFEHAVFGIIKVREILDYYLHYNEDWKFYLLKLLENVYSLHEFSQSGSTDCQYDIERLSENIALLKTYIAEESNVINRKEMSVALVILDLMDKGAKMKNGASL